VGRNRRVCANSMLFHFCNKLGFSQISRRISPTFYNLCCLYRNNVTNIIDRDVCIAVKLPWLHIQESWGNHVLAFHFELLVTNQ
jgi:hypothetical protein